MSTNAILLVENPASDIEKVPTTTNKFDRGLAVLHNICIGEPSIDHHIKLHQETKDSHDRHTLAGIIAGKDNLIDANDPSFVSVGGHSHERFKFILLSEFIHTSAYGIHHVDDDAEIKVNGTERHHKTNSTDLEGHHITHCNPYHCTTTSKAGQFGLPIVGDVNNIGGIGDTMTNIEVQDSIDALDGLGCTHAIHILTVSFEQKIGAESKHKPTFNIEDGMADNVVADTATKDLNVHGVAPVGNSSHIAGLDQISTGSDVIGHASADNIDDVEQRCITRHNIIVIDTDVTKSQITSSTGCSHQNISASRDAEATSSERQKSMAIRCNKHAERDVLIVKTFADTLTFKNPLEVTPLSAPETELDQGIPIFDSNVADENGNSADNNSFASLG